MKKLKTVSLTGCLVFLGACGFTEHQVVVETCALMPGGRVITCEAECPAGKKVTGGGWSVAEVVVTLEAETINRGRVLSDAPANINNDAWRVVFEPHPRATGNLGVWAICANVGSP